jgi:small subunit ribosomal protein S1
MTKKTLKDFVDESGKKTVVKTKKPLEKTDVETSVMGALIEKHPFDIPQVGDVLEGVVIDVASHSALLDLGSLGTGIVLGKEMKSGLGTGAKLKIGEKVTATLTDLENEDGFIELSIREASYEKSWDDIESKRDNKDVVVTKVLEANKGGLMIEINGIVGFLPVSQLASDHYPRVEDGDKNKILELLRKLIGQELTVRILDADRDNEKLIGSEKAAQSEKEREIISNLRVGDTVEGDVSGVVDFGAFVKFPSPSGKKGEKLEGLVHISELAWQLIDDPREIVKMGDVVKAQIIGIEDTRISLSMKTLKEDPWSRVKEKYHVGDIVDGKVDKINHFGSFVYLDKDIHGLAHVSEFQDVYPGKKMEDIFKHGEICKWKILSIEPKSHRMGLLPVK